MFCIYDSFNDKILSRHRSLKAAAKAKKPHFLCGIRRLNGNSTQKMSDREIDELFEIFDRME